MFQPTILIKQTLSVEDGSSSIISREQLKSVVEVISGEGETDLELKVCSIGLPFRNNILSVVKITIRTSMHAT